MKSNQKGISLVALVVTVIVLIILAGVAISTLNKEDGIIKNTRYAKASNIYYEAEQQVKLAHTAVLSDILNKSAFIDNYDPTTAEETERLANMVKKDLGITSGNSNGTWTVESEAGKIKITFTNSKIVQGGLGEATITTTKDETATVDIPREEGEVHYQINLLATQDAKLYVDTSPAKPFGTYGNAVATKSVAGTYGTLGTAVQLNSGNAITVGSATIADNWKVFYEDENFVYLIYRGYYPATGVQTNSDASTIRLKPSSYTCGVNDSTNRINLLRYLRNDKGYEWDSVNMLDVKGTGANNTYASWNNLKTALSGLSSLSGKTIAIQGSPDIELWDKSWVASGNSTIINTSDKVNSNGYKIYGSTSSKNLKTASPWKSTANSTNHTGYYDTMYFPYTSSQSTADGYRLASPGGGNAGSVCHVFYSGNVSCVGTYNTSSYCARPVVSIAK